MQIPAVLADIENRVIQVLTAITASDEWRRHSEELHSREWLDSRAPFVRFFDVYEGRSGEDWLGILEWAVIEVLRTEGNKVVPDQTYTTQVIAKMSGHPDLKIQS